MSEKTFTMYYGSGSVEMTNFEVVEECIFENFFNNLSESEREVLISDAAAMAEYVSTIDEVCQDEDYGDPTDPLSDEEKATISQNLRAEYQRRLEEEKEEEE